MSESAYDSPKDLYPSQQNAPVTEQGEEHVKEEVGSIGLVPGGSLEAESEESLPVWMVSLHAPTVGFSETLYRSTGHRGQEM